MGRNLRWLDWRKWPAHPHVLGNGTGTLIPGCARACAEDAMAAPLLQESRVRSPNTIPQAMSTFPSISSEDMATMQRGDEAIGRLWYYWVRKHPQLFVS